MGEVPEGGDADDLATKALHQPFKIGHGLAGADQVIDEQEPLPANQIFDLRASVGPSGPGVAYATFALGSRKPAVSNARPAPQIDGVATVWM